jgi:hypothetical protein
MVIVDGIMAMIAGSWGGGKLVGTPKSYDDLDVKTL